MVSIMDISILEERFDYIYSCTKDQVKDCEDQESSYKNLASDVVKAFGFIHSMSEFERLTNLFYHLQEKLIFDYSSICSEIPPVHPFSISYPTIDRIEAEVRGCTETTPFTDIEYNEQIHLLNNYIQALNSKDEIASVLRVASKAALRITRAERSIALTVDKQNHLVDSIFARNYSIKHLRENLTYDLIMKGISGQVLDTGDIVRLKDALINKWNRGKALEHAKSHKTGPIMVLPLIVNRITIGTITTCKSQSLKDQPFTDIDESLLNILCKYVSIKIENLCHTKPTLNIEIHNKNNESAEIHKFSNLLRKVRDELKHSKLIPDINETLLQSILKFMIGIEQIKIITHNKKYLVGEYYDETDEYYNSFPLIYKTHEIGEFRVKFKDSRNPLNHELRCLRLLAKAGAQALFKNSYHHKMERAEYKADYQEDGEYEDQCVSYEGGGYVKELETKRIVETSFSGCHSFKDAA